MQKQAVPGNGAPKGTVVKVITIRRCVGAVRLRSRCRMALVGQLIRTTRMRRT